MIFRSKLPDLEIPHGNLVDVALQHCDRMGDKPALMDGPSGRQITYAELPVMVRRFATGLAQRGFGKGDVLAIFMPNLPEYGVAFLGAAYIGGVNTTVNSLYSTDDLIHQFKDSGARFLLTIPDFLDRAMPAAQASGIEEIFVLGSAENCTPYAELLNNAGDAPQAEVDPATDMVAMPYSSGTTGLAKGVMLNHSNLVANFVLSSEVNPQVEGDKMFAVLPFFHIYGMVLLLCLALYNGVTLLTSVRFDLEQFLQIVQDQKVTLLSLVPPLVLALARQPIVDKYDLSSVRLITCGAAPLGVDLEEDCGKRLDCGIIQGYGLTEVAGACHIRALGSDLDRPGSVGPVLQNTESKVIDVETGAALGPNENGEVLVRGPHIMLGYLNNPEATAHSIDEEGWFHTGDIGYADDDGCFYIVDRVKELIKYKAYQVAPAELEALLLTHEAIADAAVIPSPDEEAGEIPKAFVLLKGELSEQDLMAWVAERVAPHKKIRRVEFVDEIPKSASGKILRRLLVEKERQQVAG